MKLKETAPLKIISKKDNLNYENLNWIALFVKIIAVYLLKISNILFFI